MVVVTLAVLVDDDSVGKTDDCIASYLIGTPLASRDHHFSIHNASDPEGVNKRCIDSSSSGSIIAFRE